MTAPLCPCCGRPLPKRTTYIDLTIKDKKSVPLDQRPKTRAEAQRLTNHEIVSVSRSTDKTYIHSVNVWDGETYGRDKRRSLFCTDECARSFATAAHKAGYRIKGRA